MVMPPPPCSVYFTLHTNVLYTNLVYSMFLNEMGVRPPASQERW